MRYNAMRMFKTEDEARKFAKEVGSESWGWEREFKNGKLGKITGWYVDCNEQDGGC